MWCVARTASVPTVLAWCRGHECSSLLRICVSLVGCCLTPPLPPMRRYSGWPPDRRLQGTPAGRGRLGASLALLLMCSRAGGAVRLHAVGGDIDLGCEPGRPLCLLLFGRYSPSLRGQGRVKRVLRAACCSSCGYTGRQGLRLGLGLLWRGRSLYLGVLMVLMVSGRVCGAAALARRAPHVRVLRS